jgi:predicted nuclease of predicted toxin-antitoxin system
MIIADENIDSHIISALRDSGVEVFSISEELSGIDDFEIIELARKADLIILTEDKDFGEWVFAHKVENISVIFLRYHFSEIQMMIPTLIKLIANENFNLKGYFTTITPKKIRQRKI